MGVSRAGRVLAPAGFGPRGERLNALNALLDAALIGFNPNLPSIVDEIMTDNRLYAVT
jgi:hypothetical protein